MGLWGKLVAYSAGSVEDITCRTCGSEYRGNTDRRFPYAICGRCLGRERDRAAERGDRETYAAAETELQRRRNLHF